jgi:predicted ArsR family transcriptional regulator
MKGTRAQIVELLRQRGEMSVAELAEALDIAPPALRRHLDILAAEGLVAYRAVKQHTGRPYFAYRLTEQAQEAAATGYARLLERLIRDAAAMPAGDGRRAMLEALLDRLAEHLAEDYRTRVTGTTLEERVRSLTEALRAEGIVERYETREDGFHLYTSACPHRRAALAAHALCGSERRAIALMLGEEVDQVARLVDGGPCCEYVVRPRDDSALVVVE